METLILEKETFNSSSSSQAAKVIRRKVRNNPGNMEELAGNWITFKDSISDRFRVRFPLVSLLTPRPEAWQFADSTESESHSTGSARLGQTSPTHFDGCTLSIEICGQILIF